MAGIFNAQSIIELLGTIRQIVADVVRSHSQHAIGPQEAIRRMREVTRNLTRIDSLVVERNEMLALLSDCNVSNICTLY